MKAHKRLNRALADIIKTASDKAFKQWLNSQPGSTHRGIANGKLSVDVLRAQFDRASNDEKSRLLTAQRSLDHYKSSLRI
jgi:hypothetical protein